MPLMLLLLLPLLPLLRVLRGIERGAFRYTPDALAIAVTAQYFLSLLPLSQCIFSLIEHNPLAVKAIVAVASWRCS